jgi:hypothetical protein
LSLSLGDEITHIAVEINHLLTVDLLGDVMKLSASLVTFVSSVKRKIGIDMKKRSLTTLKPQIHSFLHGRNIQ